METIITGLFWEISLLGTLGLVYYFYQRKKILNYEKNRLSDLLSFMLQQSLVERGDKENHELDRIIVQLDDSLKSGSQNFPIDNLRRYSQRKDCSEEYREIIKALLNEINENNKE
jgi:hypothetical protein